MKPDEHTKKRLDLLQESVIKKVNNNKGAHDKLFKAIVGDAIASLDIWINLSSPTNTITAEGKGFIEQIRKSIHIGASAFVEELKR